MDKIKILHVLGALNCGGAENMVMNFFRALKDGDISFDFILHTSEKCFFTDEALDLGATIYSCPKYRLYNHFAYKKWWENFFKNHPEYKIVHCHVRSTAYIICRAASEYGVKTIVHSHSTSDGKGLSSIIKKIYRKKIADNADYFFSCSDNAGKWLFGNNIISSDRYFLIPNAIDISKYRPDEKIADEVRDELNLQDKKVYLHAGRFIKAKNHKFLIKLFERIYAQDRSSVLLLAGDGKLQKSIEKKVKRSGLEGAVVFLGVRADLNRIMQAAQIFLFPSLWEGLPLTVIEAQAAGLHCFVSDSVTTDVCVTPLVSRLRVTGKEALNIWAREVSASDTGKKDFFSEIKQAGYEIYSAAEKLKMIYMNIFESIDAIIF